jgi:hypothetical protein
VLYYTNSILLLIFSIRLYLILFIMYINYIILHIIFIILLSDSIRHINFMVLHMKLYTLYYVTYYQVASNIIVGGGIGRGSNEGDEKAGSKSTLHQNSCHLVILFLIMVPLQMRIKWNPLSERIT